MDDEKSITKKLTDVISRAAGSVKSAVSHVVDTASDAAQHAMEVNAQKISRIPAVKPDPEQVAGMTNEQIYVPEASDAAAMPMPLFPVAAAPKKRKVTSKPARAKTAPAKAKAAPKKAAKKKASASKAATKSANKVAKKRSIKKTKKAAKKSSVRSSKNARRKSGK